MTEFDEHWISTYTGKKFHYLNPQLEEIDILDIAHALALTCRFGGHCRVYYSVADHSVNVARLCKPGNRLAALLHDAHEAYVPDIPSPIKMDLPMVRDLNMNIQEAIHTKFGGFKADWEEIQHMDKVMLATEARDLMLTTVDWAELPTPMVSALLPRTPTQSENEFLKEFYLGSGLLEEMWSWKKKYQLK